MRWIGHTYTQATSLCIMQCTRTQNPCSAPKKQVMMHRVQSSVMREEPNTQPMNGQRDVVNNELDDAGEPVDMWTAIRCVSGGVFCRGCVSNMYVKGVLKCMAVTRVASTRPLFTYNHIRQKRRDLQNRDIPQPPATSTPTPLQNTTATQPTQPQPTAPTKPTTTRPRTSKLLKRAHTQVDPMVGVQQQHTRAPTAGPPPHASLQHAESDAAGINPAWLGGAGGGAQHAQHGGGQVGGRGHGHGRGVGRGGGSAPPTSSKTCIKPPMQLTFPIQPPARHCRVCVIVTCVCCSGVCVMCCMCIMHHRKQQHVCLLTMHSNNNRTTLSSSSSSSSAHMHPPLPPILSNPHPLHIRTTPPPSPWTQQHACSNSFPPTTCLCANSLQCAPPRGPPPLG